MLKGENKMLLQSWPRWAKAGIIGVASGFIVLFIFFLILVSPYLTNDLNDVLKIPLLIMLWPVSLFQGGFNSRLLIFSTEVTSLIIYYFFLGLIVSFTSGKYKK